MIAENGSSACPEYDQAMCATEHFSGGGLVSLRCGFEASLGES
jgi:hypothetical protein